MSEVTKNDQPSVDVIFYAALEIDNPDTRAAYLDKACGDNRELRRRVEKLLDAHGRAGTFLESVAPGPALSAGKPLREGPGAVIGPYKLLEQIGEGGFGLVFLAEQQQPVRRQVAVKILKPGMDSRQIIARFEAERQTLALMDHTNIAKVLDAGETLLGRPYFVMELCRGVPLTDYCDQNALTLRERLELFVSVCQAVQHAHHKGIIHRDLKPSNVLVTMQDGVPVAKVIDFGVAKALGQQLSDKVVQTGATQIVGTPLYMSPEQADLGSQDIDTRTDIYSLSVVLYELLTGATPFDKEQLSAVGYDELRRIIREKEPAKPSTRLSTLGLKASAVSSRRQSDPKRLQQLLRGELDWIVMKGLEKDRSRRYETASALAADVQRYLQDEPVAACPPSRWYRFRKFGKRNKTILTAIALVFAALVGGTAVSTWQAIRATNASNSERQMRIDLDKARIHAVEQTEKVRQDLARLAEANFLMQRGQFLANAGQWIRANDDFGQAVELRPDHAVVWFQRAEFYAKLGLWDRAITDYAKSFELRPPPAPRPWFLFALLNVYLGDAESYQQLARALPTHFPTPAERGGAENEVVRAYTLTSHPGANWPWAIDLAKDIGEPPNAPLWSVTALGAAYYRAGKYAEAQSRLEAGLNLRPPTWKGSGSTYALLAMTHFRLGNAVKARDALLEAQKIVDRQAEDLLNAPVAASPMNWMDWMYNVILYREALTLIQKASVPEDPRLWVIRARALAELHWGDQAEAALAKAAELPSTKLPVVLTRYRIYAELRQWDRAAAPLSEYLAYLIDSAETNTEPDATLRALATTWKELAEHQKTAGRPLEAARASQYGTDVFYVLMLRVYLRDWATVLAKQKPTDMRRAIASETKAQHYVALRQWDKALANYSQAIEIYPRGARAWEGRGRTYALMGQWDKALADFSKGLVIWPASAPLLCCQARVYALRGEWDKALADGDKAIQLNPKDAVGYNESAWLLANHPNPQVRDLSRALELAKKATALDSKKEGNYWTTLGVISYRLGDWKATIAALEESQKKNREQPQWLSPRDNSLNYLFLAMAVWQLGDKDQARRWYDRAVLEMELRQSERAGLHGFRREAAQLLGLEPKIQ